MSPDQADGFVRLVTRHVSAEVSEALRRAVQARGVESLTSAEAVVWAFVCVPNGTVWADLVSQRFDVEAKAAFVSGRAQGFSDLITRLQESVPLRTVFQAFLAAHNAVVQRPLAGYTLQYLLSTHNERLGSWSTERLVVELLEAAQMRRSRLRLMRKIAVGHLPLNNASRRHVWRFLDDLSASLWDALPLLLTCKGDMCDTDFICDIRAKSDCMRGLERRAGEVLRSIQPNSLLFVQTTELQRQAAAGVVTCQVALDTVLQCFQAALRLVRIQRDIV